MISKRELINWIEEEEYDYYEVTSFQQWYEIVENDYYDIAESYILSDIKSEEERSVLMDYYFNKISNPCYTISFRLNMMFIHDLNIIIICDDIDELELKLDTLNIDYSDSWDAISKTR